MDSNHIEKSEVAGRDIYTHSYPVQPMNQCKSVDIDTVVEQLYKRLRESKPATDHISKEAMAYFVSKTKELELILDVYMNAVVECFYCMKLEDRTRISIKIMDERKKIRLGNHIK